MIPDQKQLTRHVQYNCHISDARHAGNYTLCVYLLKMREFYRWELAHPFNTTLSTDDIGEWLTEREDLWSELENKDYAPIEINGGRFDPFDSSGINQKILEHGLVYSGGLGHKSKPHFFLGKLERSEQHNGYHILVSAEEYARDMTSLPAMSQDKTIFIRRESFKRMIWEKIEEWRWNRPQNAMMRAMQCYDFDNDLEGSLNAMTDNELEAAILHEIGEINAGEQLIGWREMMTDITFTPAEIMARAVRDHLADSISTLPALLEHNNEASIHFYFANLNHMRKKIYPSLESAYKHWLDTKSTAQLEHAIAASNKHWSNIATEMLALHRQDRKACSDKIEALVRDNPL